MPFEKGNKLGARPRIFDEELRKAIAQDDRKKVRRCVVKMMTLAAKGEPWATRELADRLDGKAHQSVDLSNADGTALFSSIERVILQKPSK
jgi:hypothetical protein